MRYIPYSVRDNLFSFRPSASITGTEIGVDLMLFPVEDVACLAGACAFVYANFPALRSRLDSALSRAIDSADCDDFVGFDIYETIFFESMRVFRVPRASLPSFFSEYYAQFDRLDGFRFYRKLNLSSLSDFLV